MLDRLTIKTPIPYAEKQLDFMAVPKYSIPNLVRQTLAQPIGTIATDKQFEAVNGRMITTNEGALVTSNLLPKYKSEYVECMLPGGGGPMLFNFSQPVKLVYCDGYSTELGAMADGFRYWLRLDMIATVPTSLHIGLDRNKALLVEYPCQNFRFIVSPGLLVDTYFGVTGFY